MKSVFKIILLFVFGGIPYTLIAYPFFRFGIQGVVNEFVEVLSLISFLLISGVYLNVIYNWLSKYFD